MEDRLIDTAQGTIAFRRCTADIVAALRSRWPMGLFHDQSQQLYGLVFQVGDREMMAAKAQSPDIPEEHRTGSMALCRFRIAAALPRYMRRGHAGITLPCVYMREKQQGQVEVGIAIFVSPGENAPQDPEAARMGFDQAMGAGAGVMILDFLGDLTESGRERGLPTHPLIGVDLRARLALGTIVFDTMLLGTEVLSLKRRVDSDDPLWEMLAGEGVTSIWMLPSVPAAKENSAKPR